MPFGFAAGRRGLENITRKYISCEVTIFRWELDCTRICFGISRGRMHGQPLAIVKQKQKLIHL